jgi:hypothetical protein
MAKSPKPRGFSDTYTRAHHGVFRVRPLEPRHLRVKCGAQTRRGTFCQRKALANGRCPNHGGLSTGPKTEGGRKRIAAAVSAAQRRRWAAWRRDKCAKGKPARALS